MFNYCLWFRTQRNEPRGVNAEEIFSRVISAPDLVTAMEVAQAMVGEEVYGDQFLSGLIQVLETSDESNLVENCFADGSYVWDRVLKKLGLTIVNVEFIRITYTVHCEKHSEIVGFKRRAA